MTRLLHVPVLAGLVLAALVAPAHAAPGPAHAVASQALPVHAGPTHAAPAPAPRSLAALTAELSAVTAQAQQLSDALDAAAASDAGVQVALDRLQQQHDDALTHLEQQARTAYMTQQPDPLAQWQEVLADPELRELARRASGATLVVDQAVVDAVGAQSAALTQVQRRAAARHQVLLRQARGVFAAQDRARALLAQAQVVADARHDALVQAVLARQRAALDAVSADVTVALTPAQSARTRAAAAVQQPVLALLEQAGSGLPAGYAVSGTTFSGEASWYGPGFVGSPTASGAPYDPEQLTCAHKTLPLGTVLHVTANGRSVNCLVNDRGPYVGDRVLDMSRAGSRALGYDGVAQVTAEVLVPAP